MSAHAKTNHSCARIPPTPPLEERTSDRSRVARASLLWRSRETDRSAPSAEPALAASRLRAPIDHLASRVAARRTVGRRVAKHGASTEARIGLHGSVSNTNRED